MSGSGRCGGRPSGGQLARRPAAAGQASMFCRMCLYDTLYSQVVTHAGADCLYCCIVACTDLRNSTGCKTVTMATPLLFNSGLVKYKARLHSIYFYIFVCVCV